MWAVLGWMAASYVAGLVFTALCLWVAVGLEELVAEWQAAIVLLVVWPTFWVVAFLQALRGESLFDDYDAELDQATLRIREWDEHDEATCEVCQREWLNPGGEDTE